MNERIRQLAEQAKEETDALYAKLTPQEFKDTYNQKFAELIVKECMDVAHTHTPQTEECEYQWLIHNKIKEHFGVEE
jgi:non-homologous end joining protein Ku